MAIKPVVFNRGALSDIAEAFAWYAKHSQRAADNFKLEVEAARSPIAEAPQRWAKHHAGIRRYLLHHYPYAIIYRELEDCIQVVAVWHGKRRNRKWQSRLNED